MVPALEACVVMRFKLRQGSNAKIGNSCRQTDRFPWFVGQQAGERLLLQIEADNPEIAHLAKAIHIAADVKAVKSRIGRFDFFQGFLSTANSALIGLTGPALPAPPAAYPPDNLPKAPGTRLQASDNRSKLIFPYCKK